MKTSTRVKFNLINIIVFTICGIIVFIGNGIINDIDNNSINLKNRIEQHWRQQARYHISSIISQLDEDYHNDIVDLYDNESLYKWSSLRFNGIRNGSPSSDGWIAELGTEEFIYNQDIEDIDNDIIYFNDKISNSVNSSIEPVFNRIRLGIPSQYGENIQLDNNGGKTWIEFAYYPINNGLKGESYIVRGKKNENYRRIVVVVETKSHEIYKNYESYFIEQDKIIGNTYITIIASIILGILFLLSILFRHKE